ncbi:hypothetical protein BDC45DRAFT_176539 [Circinella umbellata]|nr:hypothetical protein BDC45DRAFT_176539 [Circinella umbellata]
MWSAYSNAFEDLNKEETYNSKIQKYLKECHKYLLQPRLQKAFETAVNECKERFKEVEVERPLERARIRAEQEGGIFGADLTERGINEHRKRIQRESSESLQQIAEEQRNEPLDAGDTGLDIDESIDVHGEALEDPFQVSDNEEKNKDELCVVRYNKVYHIQTSGNNLLSPHKPKLQELDISLLNDHFAIRISTTLKAQVDQETETIYQDYKKAAQSNEALKKLDNAWEFCTGALRQNQDGFCKWLWNQEPTSKDKKFIEMMKYILTDFHLNCITKTPSINDERTPFVENMVPPFKAFAKVLSALNFVWCERALSARKFVIFRTVEPHMKKADGIGRVPGYDHDLNIIESSG